MDKGVKILVVEDNFMNKVLVREMLTLNGYEILEAETGEEAVEMVLGKKESPDIILMDINLPVMDGITATKTIKAEEGFEDTYIIAITAAAMKGDEREFIERGFDGYVAKPIDMKKLIVAIEEGLA